MLLHFTLAALILLTGNVMKYLPLVAAANLLATIQILIGLQSMRRAMRASAEVDDATAEG
jgi:hypothetical protein